MTQTNYYWEVEMFSMSNKSLSSDESSINHRLSPCDTCG
jgi:hypothetical protein